MPDPRLIGPPPRSTPAELKKTAGRRRALPDDLLREASRRLKITALLLGALWVLATVADHLALRALYPGDPR